MSIEQSESSVLLQVEQLIDEKKTSEATRLILPLLQQGSQNSRAWRLASRLTADPNRKKQYSLRAEALDIQETELLSPAKSMQTGFAPIKTDTRTNAPKRDVNWVALLLGVIVVALTGLILIGLSLLQTAQSFVTSDERVKVEYMVSVYTKFADIISGESPVSFGYITDDALDKAVFGAVNECVNQLREPNPNPRLYTTECTPLSPTLLSLLTAAGREGWEVVSIIDKSNENSFSVEIYFKR